MSFGKMNTHIEIVATVPVKDADGFLTTIILVAGLVTYNANMILGIGLMLSATEVPRIAGTFGLDTSMRTNFMSAAYSAQAAVNLARTAAKAFAKTP